MRQSSLFTLHVRVCVCVCFSQAYASMYLIIFTKYVEYNETLFCCHDQLQNTAIVIQKWGENFQIIHLLNHLW